MKIYTKTGDDGTTGLFGGGRLPKDAVRIEAYGTVDELNSVIGIVRNQSAPKRLAEMLREIQNDLFDLGADLATPMSTKNDYIVRMADSDTVRIEKWIDELDGALPALTNFILPAGSPAATYLHLARNVCRRAERLVVRLSHSEETGTPVKTYLNRLSDLLFVMARYANHSAGVADEAWTKKDRR